MGQAEARRMMPFIMRGAKQRVNKFARMANRVEIIPEVQFGRMSKEALDWRKELEEARSKILKIDREYVFQGNESLNELAAIYDRVKSSIAGKTERPEPGGDKRA